MCAASRPKIKHVIVSLEAWTFPVVLLSLQGIAARRVAAVGCALWSLGAGAAVGCALWSLGAGAAAGYVCALELSCRSRWRVPLPELLQGAIARYLMLGRVRFRAVVLVPLQVATARCVATCAVCAFETVVGPLPEWLCAVEGAAAATPQKSFRSLGLCWRNSLDSVSFWGSYFKKRAACVRLRAWVQGAAAWELEHRASAPTEQVECILAASCEHANKTFGNVKSPTFLRINTYK